MFFPDGLAESGAGGLLAHVLTFLEAVLWWMAYGLQGPCHAHPAANHPKYQGLGRARQARPGATRFISFQNETPERNTFDEKAGDMAP
jgi:hypothetical protein